MHYLSLLLHDGEDPLNANADAHTWDFPALGVKHAHQAVITPSTSHAAHTDTLLCRCPVLGVGGCRGNTGLSQHCLVNDSCVIVETTSQTEVEHHLEQKMSRRKAK